MSATLASRRSRAFVVATLVSAAVGASWSIPAASQPSEPEIGELRRLFQDAIALEDQGRWADALEKFRKVGEGKMTPQVRFHIAFTEENVGLLAAALRDYDEAEKLAREAGAGAKDVAESAPVRSAALRSRVPTVKIEVRGRGSVQVVLDGQALARSALGTEMLVDPGKHTVSLTRTAPSGPADAVEKTFEVVEGQKKVVIIDTPGEATHEPPPPNVVVPEKKPAPPEKGTKVPAIVVGSVGAASLVGAGVFLGLRQKAISDVRDGCSDPEHDKGCNPELQATANNGRTFTYVSAALAAVGVAGLATGAVLWVTVGADKPARGAAKVTVSPGFVSFATAF